MKINSVFISERARFSAHIEEWLARIPQNAAVRYYDEHLPNEAFKNDAVIIDICRGNFIKPFNQGTADAVVAGEEFAIALGQGCPLGCAYCFLHFYLDSTPGMRLYINWEDFESEFMNFMSERGQDEKTVVRFNAGELNDSLLYESLTHHSQMLVELFRDYPNARLELRTKTANIDELLTIDSPPENVTVAWSLNPPSVIAQYEKNAAPLAERLAAAKKMHAAGYRIAFRIDPMIRVESWRENYGALLDETLATIPPENIAYIAVGALRFAPAFRSIAAHNRDSASLLTDEFVSGLDGKMRYFRPLRREMLSFVVSRLRAADIKTSLCMETKQMNEDIKF